VSCRPIREACERLVHLDAPPSDIALDLDFDDFARFTRFCKRITGEIRGRIGRGEGRDGSVI
jgi:hypothetical protein